MKEKDCLYHDKESTFREGKEPFICLDVLGEYK